MTDHECVTLLHIQQTGLSEWSYDYIKSGASRKGKCLVLSRTVESLPCLQNTDISRMTPADHKILNIAEVFSQFTEGLFL